MIEASVVVVPAHDEAELLPKCLAALDVALADLPAVLVVVLDSCSDRSRELCAGRTVLEIEARNVGRARAAGFDHALQQLDAPLERIWLATTDADTLVPRTWLTEQLGFANDGFDAVAGTIRVDDWSDYTTSLAARFSEFYTRGGDSHPHVHGANLGVRASAYREVGGFQALETAEDHALWNALADYRRISTRANPVVTSARRKGRAPAGFANFLVVMEAG